MRKIVSVVFVMLLLLSLLPAFQAPVLADNENPNGQGKILGPWNITLLKTYKDRTIEVCGNITIKAGGTLSLDHVKLIINSTAKDEYYIIVETGGVLKLLNGTQVTNNATFDKPYFLTVNYGATVQIVGSELRRMGNSTAGMSLATLARTGFLLESNAASIVDSVIDDSFAGTVCTYILPIKPTITNVTYKNNSLGLAVGFGCSPTMHGNKYIGNADGLAVALKGKTVTDISKDLFHGNTLAIGVTASTLSIKDTTIENSTGAGIGSMAGGIVDLSNVTLSGNNNATYMDNSSLTIVGSTVTASGQWDFFVDNVSRVKVTNTTIDDRLGIKVNDTGSELDLMWYLNVRALNTTGAPVVGALVNVTDSHSTRVFSTATDATGWTGNILITELKDQGTGPVKLTPHNVTAEKGALWNLTAVNVDHTQKAVLNMWERDLVAPLVTIDSPQDAEHVNATELQVSGAASDDKGLALVELSNDTGAWTKAAGTATWSGIVNLTGDGSQQICARATDTSGNKATICVQVTLDTVPPTLTVDEPVDGQYFNHSQLFVKGSTDADIVQVNGDPVTVFNGNFSYALTLAKEGPNDLALVAMDLAGNRDSVSVRVYRDLVAPTVVILSPLPGALVPTNAFVVAGNVTDAQGIVGLWASTDNATWKGADVNYSGAQGTAGAFTASFSLPEGNHTVFLKAVDRANNTGRAVINFAIKLPDVTAPTVTVASPKDGQKITGLLFQVNGTAKDDVGVDRVEVSLDGTLWTLAGTKDKWAHWSLNMSLKEGSDTIYVRAFDQAGNKGVALVTVTAVKPFVDTEKPVVSVTSHKDGTTVNKQKIVLRGVASDNVKVKSILVSATGATNATWIAATLEPGNNSWSLEVTLKNGWNEIAIRASDDAGNTNTTTLSLKYAKSQRTAGINYWMVGIFLLIILVLAVVYVLTLPGREKAKKAKDEPLPGEDDEEGTDEEE